MADINLEKMVLDKLKEGINMLDKDREATVVIHNFFDSEDLWVGLFLSENEKGKGIGVDSFIWMKDELQLISQRRLHCLIDNSLDITMPAFDWYVFKSLVAEISYIISAFYADLNKLPV